MRLGRTSLLIWTVALTLAMAGAASAQNLLTNWGFENPIGTEWTFQGISGNLASWSWGVSTAKYHSGTSSLLLQFANDNTGSAYVEQVLSGLAPGATYNISGWIYHGFRADKSWSSIQAYSGNSILQAPAKGANVLTTWTQYNFTQTADSGGGMLFRLYVNKYGTTTGGKIAYACFDDLSVTAVPEPSGLLALLAGLPAVGLAVRRRK